MKIISWNVNGIRAVHKKGFLEWMNKEKPDIVCLQEIKAKPQQIPVDLQEIKGYFVYFNPAERPGYSGTCVYTKQKPLTVEKTIGFKRFDKEGRVLKLKYPNFTLFNFYIPHGSRDQRHMKYKLNVYEYLSGYLKGLKKEKLILVGDFNISHKEIDLARPKQNENNTGFTHQERMELDHLLALGFIDSFRKFHKGGGHYTWWAYFANARARNIGWRLDYCFVSKNFSRELKDGFILPKVTGSDHCPIGVSMRDVF